MLEAYHRKEKRRQKYQKTLDNIRTTANLNQPVLAQKLVPCPDTPNVSQKLVSLCRQPVFRAPVNVCCDSKSERTVEVLDFQSTAYTTPPIGA